MLRMTFRSLYTWHLKKHTADAVPKIFVPNEVAKLCGKKSFGYPSPPAVSRTDIAADLVAISAAIEFEYDEYDCV